MLLYGSVLTQSTALTLQAAVSRRFSYLQRYAWPTPDSSSQGNKIRAKNREVVERGGEHTHQSVQLRASGLGDLRGCMFTLRI